MAYRHKDPDIWLQWVGFVGHNFPEQVKDIALEHCGFSCHRYKQSHLWLQGFTWTVPPEGEGEPELFADALQGKDSIFPGVMIKKINVKLLTACDCGNWLPPTKEQGAMAEQRYKAAVKRAKRRLN